MKSLARTATADLRELIRKDPATRVAAWAEIKFRNQSRQAFERENGFRPGARVEPWFPPDLSDPTPPPND